MKKEMMMIVRIQRLRDTGNWTQFSTCINPSDSILNHTMKTIAKQKMNGYTNTVRAVDDSGMLVNILHG
jgi:hypothetical protein